MTSVQVPRTLMALLPRYKVHARQPFYELIVAAVTKAFADGGGEPP